MAAVPEAQAMDSKLQGPRSPKTRQRWSSAVWNAASPTGGAAGPSVGALSRARPPFAPKITDRANASHAIAPPKLVESTAPVASGCRAAPPRSPASASASRAAVSRNWVASSGASESPNAAGSNDQSQTCPALSLRRPAGSNLVRWPTPRRPSIRPAQKSDRLWPRGVTAPRPVMTTRRMEILPWCGRLWGDGTLLPASLYEVER